MDAVASDDRRHVTGHRSGIPASDSRQQDFLKAIDSATNDFRNLAEHWHNELTLQGQSLAERYAKHGVTIICDLDVSVP